MVTYSLCRAKPQVRLLAPHPIFVFLAILLLSGSAMAADPQVVSGDIDHYAAAPDTLVVAASSSDSLARVVGGDIFGHYWSSFGGNGQITAIDGVSMKDRADGVQELATATYSTFKGVETAIANAAATDPLVLQWLEQIYDQLYTSSRSGDVVTKTSIADLLSDLLARNSNGAYRYDGVTVKGLNLSDLLSFMSLNAFEYFSFSGSILGSSGSLLSGARRPLSSIVSAGFMGLSSLLFPQSSSSVIYGLSYTGDDKEGFRGSWSLADITANGMQGLATLIGGQDSGDGRKAVWYWVDPSDPLAPVRNYEATSLFDLFWQIGLLQNSLAKLEYVYASQEDMEFKEQEKPNMDAVKDNFFGDGEGAVNPDQIKEVAGIGTSFKAAFTPPVSIAQFFSTLSDGGNYVFFSQETADNLDRVNSASSVAQEEVDPYDGFILGEDGLYYPDNSVFDLYSYLEDLS